MPLHVDIRINDHLLNTLHIGRVSGGGASFLVWLFHKNMDVGFRKNMNVLSAVHV
jgi:hypothetical protein